MDLNFCSFFTLPPLAIKLTRLFAPNLLKPSNNKTDSNHAVLQLMSRPGENFDKPKREMVNCAEEYKLATTISTRNFVKLEG